MVTVRALFMASIAVAPERWCVISSSFSAVGRLVVRGIGDGAARAVCDRAAPTKLGLEGEQQCLVVREGHSVRLPGMPLDLCDEPFLVRRAGFEPAFAMQNLVHDSSRARLERRP